MRFFDFFVLYLPNGKQVSSTTKPRFGGFFYDQLLARDGQRKPSHRLWHNLYLVENKIDRNKKLGSV
tara:strand:- start:74 stop:274 length:201 start_codon:yes stop_codon:yes gene_type:complete